MTELLPLVNQALTPFFAREKLWLAYSGGLDSQVLLHLLWRLREQANIAKTPFPLLNAIHINHQLQSPAGAWAAQCQRQCADYDIPFTLRTVDVSGRRRGIEASARDARYREFEDVLCEGDVLLLAHHLDDQAETLLLRLLRGAGVSGLAAMPIRRTLGSGELFRPLLDVQRARIEAYAKEHQLSWIEDPSNTDTHYRRNFLRQRVMPQLAEHWPDYRVGFGRAARLQAEAAQLLDEYIDADLRALTADDASLDLISLAGLPEIRQRAILRQFIIQRSGLALASAQLDTIVSQFSAARSDSQPEFRLAGGSVLRVYRQRLFCGPALQVAVAPDCEWDIGRPLVFPGVGCITAEPEGDFVPRGALEIRFRQGGERCQLAGESHSRSLKKLLQEWQVPPWQREALPLIYCNGELAAIANIAICEGFRAQPGESGWNIRWEPETLT